MERRGKEAKGEGWKEKERKEAAKERGGGSFDWGTRGENST
jgi:hypothetical protein